MPKPILLIVDSDTSALAALANDLALRYGTHYDVRTALTAAQALTVLSEAGASLVLIITSRDWQDGDPLALMDRAVGLHPGAKRVLIARFIDRSAFEVIAEAMRGGRIDYFLYKPWEPPEIRLYPVIDDLLRSLLATRRESSFEFVRIVGKPGDAKCHQIRDRLARSSAPCGFYDSDSEEGKRILAQAGVDGSKLPVLVLQPRRRCRRSRISASRGGPRP